MLYRNDRFKISIGVKAMQVNIIILLIFSLIPIHGCTKRNDKASVITTRASLSQLNSAVNMFKIETGRYPSEEKGLIELIERPADVDKWAEGGYLELLPKDAWGNDFVYKLAPTSGYMYIIISYGADGIEGGSGYNSDIYSTDL